MSIKAVLFDLDGTLLPLNQEEFTKTYFEELVKIFSPLGYNSENFVKYIWACVKSTITNSTDKSNEEIFWETFELLAGEKIILQKSLFEKFYRRYFNKTKKSSWYNPKAKNVVKILKKKGIKLVLATNPIFPEIATEKRMKWGGLKKKDFCLVTTYENSRRAKPNPEYYLDLANYLNLTPQECLMVGNDVTEDMVAKTVGMKVFLLTDCLINKGNEDISVYPNGDFDELLQFMQEIKIF